MRFFFLLLFVAVACQQVNKTRMGQPVIDREFYVSAYEHVGEQQEDHPESGELLQQKLYYAEKLDWPEASVRDLKEAESKLGLTRRLAEYQSEYYLKYGEYEALKSLIRKWEATAKLTEPLFKAKLEAYTEPAAVDAIVKAYLRDYQGADAEQLAAKAYLKAGDTLMAIYHFNKLYALAPYNSSLTGRYVPLLLARGFPARAKEILIRQAGSNTDFTSGHLLARTLYQLGERYQAKGIMRRWQEEDEAKFQLAEWYRGEHKWDSAVYFTDQLIQTDSSRKAFLLKGQVLEDRGWLNSAYRTYRFLLDRNPEDSVTVQRAEIVSRKIAYLRRQREAARDVPVLDLSPKKPIENKKPIDNE